MTDQTPTTEAGRRLYDDKRIHNQAQRVKADDRHDKKWLDVILAIEAEARAEAAAPDFTRPGETPAEENARHVAEAAAPPGLDVERLLERIRTETREAVEEGDAQDCSTADCIADAVYEIVRAALAEPKP